MRTVPVATLFLAPSTPRYRKWPRERGVPPEVMELVNDRLVQAVMTCSEDGRFPAMFGPVANKIRATHGSSVQVKPVQLASMCCTVHSMGACCPQGAAAFVRGRPPHLPTLSPNTAFAQSVSECSGVCLVESAVTFKCISWWKHSVCWFVLPLPTSVQFMGNGHDFDLTYYASRNPRLKIEGRSIVLKDRPTVAGGQLLFLLFAAPLFWLLQPARAVSCACS
jgi:hypothetical protein